MRRVAVEGGGLVAECPERGDVLHLSVLGRADQVDRARGGRAIGGHGLYGQWVVSLGQGHRVEKLPVDAERIHGVSVDGHIRQRHLERVAQRDQQVVGIGDQHGLAGRVGVGIYGVGHLLHGRAQLVAGDLKGVKAQAASRQVVKCPRCGLAARIGCPIGQEDHLRRIRIRRGRATGPR